MSDQDDAATPTPTADETSARAGSESPQTPPASKNSHRSSTSGSERDQADEAPRTEIMIR